MLVESSPVPATAEAMDGLAKGAGQDAQVDILVWSKKSARTVKVWSAKGRAARIETVEWLSSGDCVFLITTTQQKEEDEPTSHLLRYDCSTAKLSEVATTRDGNSYFLIDASPIEPFALVTLCGLSPEGKETTTVRVCRTTGGLGPPVLLPADMAIVVPDFDERGQPLLIHHQRVVEANGRIRLIPTYLALNTATGAATLLTEKPKTYRYSDKPEPLEIWSLEPIKVLSGEVKPVAVREFGGKSTALVAGDADLCELAPNCQAISFAKGGLCFVRPIWKITKAEYEAIADRAARTKIMSELSQIGKALLMYAGDNDDKLPSKGDDLRELLVPYTANESVFDGFEYTYGGGLINSIANPADTVLGFKIGPGGRAVLYADAHVRWLKN
jgi:hypothetical protein